MQTHVLARVSVVEILQHATWIWRSFVFRQMHEACYNSFASTITKIYALLSTMASLCTTKQIEPAQNGLQIVFSVTVCVAESAGVGASINMALWTMLQLLIFNAYLRTYVHNTAVVCCPARHVNRSL
jgi:hypothetical protein